MSCFFFVKHYKGEKRRDSQKTKFPKHVERTFFFEKNPPTRKLEKSEIFWDKQRREISILLPKVADSEKTQRKVNEKGGIDSLEKNTHQKKGENTRMEKRTENNEKGGKERVKRRFLQRKNFLFHKNIFQKKKTKRDKSRHEKGFLKTLKKV